MRMYKTKKAGLLLQFRSTIGEKWFPVESFRYQCTLLSRESIWSLLRHGFCEQSQLVKWCFEPSQPQRITSRLNTNFTFSPSHSFHKLSYHKSCFLSLFIFSGHATREPANGRVTYLILRPAQEPCVGHSQHRKTFGWGFGKNAGEWTGSVEISKEEIPASKRSMYGYILTYSRLERENV